jgi:SAM-dependent methyltransferase
VNSAQAYPLGRTELEERRLIKQAADHEPRTRVLLDRIGVHPGWRVVDIGCGPLGILPVLSELVGPTGRVVGLEREGQFADAARAQIAQRGLHNVAIVEGDALATRLERGSFDLVHERLVAINVSARGTLLAEMLSLLRPGGIAVLQDVDNVSWLCEPAHPSWDVLLNAFHAIFRAHGGDPFVGRRLPQLLREAGAEGVQVAAHLDFAMPGDSRRAHLVSLVDSVREKIIAAKLLRDEELRRHCEVLVSHLEDPATTVVDKILVQAWGRKPA